MSGVTQGIDVLRSPLFTVAPADGPLSLAELLARLLCGPEVDGFPQLAPEQRSYWWRFLVRCAGKALHECGWSVEEAAGLGADALAGAIAETLAGLVPEGGWLLYQPDPARPGFQQVPTPDGQPPSKEGNRYELRPISLLTGALGTKNHERKADAVRQLTAEQVVFALVEYETAVVYGGSGNYGSQLMGSASGAGSGTPFMGARIGGSNHRTFRHDVQVVLDRWLEVVEQGVAGAVWALWAEPWQGGKGDELPSTQLDPAFIPLARMVRLAEPQDGMFTGVWFRPTQAKRVLDHSGGGVLGDPFTPLVREPKLKVRGVLDKGYDYSEVVQLLFGIDKFVGPSPSVAALVQLGEVERGDLSVLFEGVAYEQGKTVGFHRREVPLPAMGGISWLSRPEPVRAAHAVLQKRVSAAKTALRGAARIVLSGEPKPQPNDAGKVEPPAALLEARVDQAYFDFLFGAARQYEAEGPAARFDLPLVEWLEGEALEVFRASLGAMPCNTNERLDREVRAEAFLRSQLRNLRGEAPEGEGNGAAEGDSE